MALRWFQEPRTRHLMDIVRKDAPIAIKAQEMPRVWGTMSQKQDKDQRPNVYRIYCESQYYTASFIYILTLLHQGLTYLYGILVALLNRSNNTNNCTTH